MAFPTLNKSKFRKLMPEFSSTPSSTLDLVAECVADSFNVAVWGNKIELGHMYLIAHVLKMSKVTGSGGAVTSSKVGDLARTYAAPKDDNALKQTTYGKQYLWLISTLVTRPVIVGC